MSTTLRKRVQRLASRLDELTPPAPRQTLTILFEPRKDASPSVWETFRENLESAKQQFAEVHVFMEYQTKNAPRTEGNVIYESFDIHRIGELLAKKRNPASAVPYAGTIDVPGQSDRPAPKIFGVASDEALSEEDGGWR